MGKQFYRQGEKIFEAGSNRYIDMPEWKTNWDGQSTEVAAPGSNTSSSSSEPKDDYTRDSDGYINKLVNPLDKWKNQTSFLESAKKLIKKKQLMGGEINKQRGHLKSIYESGGRPMGGAGEEEAMLKAGLTGGISDERLSLLSPAEQRAVRSSRDTAISGQISALDDEETYRGTRMEDILEILSDTMDERNKALKENKLTNAQILDIYKNTDNPEATIAWFESRGMDATSNDTTGNRPQNNNNPGNVKAGGVADQWALKNEDGTPKVDDQNHLIFADAEKGAQGLTEDLQAKLNGNSRWVVKDPTLAQVGKAYAEDPNWTNGVVKIYNKATGSNLSTTDKADKFEFYALLEAVKTQEGFYANTKSNKEPGRITPAAPIFKKDKIEPTKTLSNLADRERLAAVGFTKEEIDNIAIILDQEGIDAVIEELSYVETVNPNLNYYSPDNYKRKDNWEEQIKVLKDILSNLTATQLENTGGEPTAEEIAAKIIKQ